MAFEVSYIITAIDKFSGVAEKIAASTKKMDASVEAAGKKLATMQERTAGAAQGWKNLANETKYFSLAAAGAIALSVREWGKQETAISKVGLTLEKSGGRLGTTIEALTENASMLASKSLFTDEDILEKVTGTLIRFKGISKESFAGAQQAALDYAQATGTDLESSSILVAKVMTKPSVAWRQMSKSLGYLSPELKKHFMELEAGGKKAELASEVLKIMNKNFGGQAQKAVYTSSGKIIMMNKDIGELAETMGQNLVPVIIPVVQWLTRMTHALGNASAPVKWIVVALMLFVAVIAPLAMIISSVITVFGALSAACTWLAAAELSVSYATLTIGAAVVVVFAAIAVLALAVYALYKYWDDIVEVLKKVWEWLTKIASEMLGGTMEFIKTISHIFSGSAEVGGKIDININDKGNNVKSATSKSNSGVALAVGQNMPAGAF